jgi:hypothetical protein
MTKYIKTAVIEAEQFDGSQQMIEKYTITPPMPFDPDYTMETLEGPMLLAVGDWIATGVNGEHWAIKDDIFKRTYTELPMIPKVVADWIDHCKTKEKSLNYSMSAVFFQNFVIENLPEDNPLIYWIRFGENQATFARAWLDGYQVEATDD